MKPGTSNKKFSIDFKEKYFNAKPQEQDIRIYTSAYGIKCFNEAIKKEAKKLNNSPP